MEFVDAGVKPVVCIKNLRFAYDKEGPKTFAGLDCVVPANAKVLLVGANGAGKSTFLKLMVGDLEPNEDAGELWKHHALRVSYIAQHSLYHLEDYLDGEQQVVPQ